MSTSARTRNQQFGVSVQWWKSSASTSGAQGSRITTLTHLISTCPSKSQCIPTELSFSPRDIAGSFFTTAASLPRSFSTVHLTAARRHIRLVARCGRSKGCLASLFPVALDCLPQLKRGTMKLVYTYSTWRDAFPRCSSLCCGLHGSAARSCCPSPRDASHRGHPCVSLVRAMYLSATAKGVVRRCALQ